MSTQIINLVVTKDHAVPIEPYGGSALVTVDNTGGTVFYADNPSVSASANQGSIAPGGNHTFTANAWLIASAAAGVQVQITPSSSSSSVTVADPPAYIIPAGGSLQQSLAGWYAAKANAATTPAIIGHFGDSIVAGNNLTDGITNAWPGRLRQLLIAAGNTWYGESYAYAPYAQNPQQVPNTRFGAWVNGNAHQLEAGLGRCMYDSVTTGTMPLETINVPAGAVACDMICLAFTAGTWQYKVDAGAPQTVTPTLTSGGTAQQNAVHYRVTIPLSGSNTTIQVGNQNAGIVMVISAVAFRYGTTGIGQIVAGHPGQSAADMTTSAGGSTASAVSGVGTSQVPGVSAPDDKYLPWTGQTSTHNTVTYGWPVNPNLAIISYYANAIARGNNPNAERRGLDRLCRAIRAGNDTCSFIFLIPSIQDEIYQASTLETLQWVGERASRFKAVIHDVCRSVGGVVIDIDQKWGEKAVTNGFLPANDVHPTGTGATTSDGHYDIAQTILSVL